MVRDPKEGCMIVFGLTFAVFTRLVYYGKEWYFKFTHISAAVKSSLLKCYVAQGNGLAKPKESKCKGRNTLILANDEQKKNINNNKKGIIARSQLSFGD